jgi:hypothetical protein
MFRYRLSPETFGYTHVDWLLSSVSGGNRTLSTPVIQHRMCLLKKTSVLTEGCLMSCRHCAVKRDK